METLAEQLTLFRAVADASYDWEEWVDSGGQLRYISPACKKITGHNREEFLANPHLVEEIVHPADQALFVSYLNQAATDPEKPLRIEYRIIHHNGGVRWIDLGYQPIYDPSGKYLGRRVSYHDITDLKHVEEELRQSHKLIQALMDAPKDIIKRVLIIY